VTYKGYTSTIQLENGSYTFSNARNSIGNTAYITDHKTRRAKREGTIYFKFLEAVDIYVANAEYKKKKREEEVSETEQTRLRLEEVAGYPVYMKEETEYSRGGRRTNHSWKSQKYYLITGQPDSYYGSFKGIQISESITGYEEEGYKTSYGVKGCNNLRVEQFKAILDILVDGRHIHAVVISPEREEN
jgi:hypothetical protein